jgi:hypothetical protein
MAYTKYSLTPANNNAAPPDGAPEGMLPSAVNDTMRDMMAQIRDVGDGIRGGTYTMTAPVITGGSITGVALSGNTFTNPVITGGSINNTPIGASTANTGAFTTLSATGATTFSGAVVMSSTLSANGGATLGDASGDALTINSSAVSIPNGLNFDSNTLVIDATNNRVGIGTSSPSAKLDVSGGNIRAIGGSNALIGAYGANSTSPQIAIGNAAGTNHWLFYETLGASGEQGSVNIYDSPTGTNRLTITTAGNVGIGTSSPSQLLDVNGTSLATTFRIRSGGFVADGGGNATFNPASGGSLAITSVGSFTNGNIVYNALAASGIHVWQSNNTERMRLDSSGNLGIGTSSPSFRLDTVTTGTAVARFQGAANGYVDITDGTGTFRAQMISNEPFLTSIGAYAMRFGTNNTERMRITSGGNVGIGNSSPNNTLSIQAGTASVRLDSSTGTNAVYSQFVNTGGSFYVGRDNSTGAVFGAAYASVLFSEGAYPMNFYTAGTERMRITSGGEVYIAGTTDQGAYNLQCNGTGVWGAGAYVNGSDERIKDDITPLDSGLDVVAKLNPVTYKYKEDWSKDQSIQTGFIAQELLTALEGKNYVDGVVQQGGQYMSVAYQNIIPILTKAIQEQQAMIEELKQEVALLKSK